ncbi:MAG: 50S ribosomal protein L20 [bacterium]
MMRVKGGPASRNKHKKILKATKGYRMTKSKLWRAAHEAYLHAGNYAFAGRRLRRRDFRKLWITRINAALTPHNIKYSRFIKLLKDNKIELNRKSLAELALNDPKAFEGLVKKVA